MDELLTRVDEAPGGVGQLGGDDTTAVGDRAAHAGHVRESEALAGEAPGGQHGEAPGLPARQKKTRGPRTAKAKGAGKAMHNASKPKTQKAAGSAMPGKKGKVVKRPGFPRQHVHGGVG